MNPVATIARHVDTLSDARFDAVYLAFALFMSAAGYLDEWMHAVDPSFVHLSLLDLVTSRVHVLLYVSVLLLAGVLLARVYGRKLGKGGGWIASIPPGYRVPVAGLAVFALAGLVDPVWHMFYGIEELGWAPLVSPTHTLLGLGTVGILAGPLLSFRHHAWTGWRRAVPMVISAMLVTGSLTSRILFAHPVARPIAAARFEPVQAELLTYHAYGVASIVLHTVLLATILLLIVRSIDIPAGFFTAVLLWESAGKVLLDPTDVAFIIPAVLAAGILLDVLYRSVPAGRRGFLLFAGIVPLVYYTCYFLAIAIGPGTWWNVHIIVGSVFHAAIIGLAVGLLLAPADAAGA